MKAMHLLWLAAWTCSAPGYARPDMAAGSGGAKEAASTRMSIAAAGGTGAALRFDGKRTFLTLRVCPPATTEMTWAAWIKFDPRSATLPQGIFTKPETGVTFVREKDGGFRLDVGNRTYRLPGLLGGVPAGDWQHVALVLTSTSASLFVNGITVGAVALTATVWPNKVAIETLLIGPGNDNNPRFLDGIVDDVRLHSRALCSEQITAMQWSPPKAEDDPIGYWDLDENDGQVVYSKAAVGPAYEGYLGSSTGRDRSDPNWTAPGGPFSDTTITFDSPDEYLQRVTNNNHADPARRYDRTHVRRVTGTPLDPLGILNLSNVRIQDPGSTTFQLVERARCKLFFGVVTARWVTCRLTFHYHFTSRDEALGVYLSNTREPLPHDPKYQSSWVRGPTAVPPAPSEPGAPETTSFADYDFTWRLSSQRLDFSKGIYVDFELRGPPRMSVQINDCTLTVTPETGMAPPWPDVVNEGCPGVQCINCCADYAGVRHCAIGPEDTIVAFVHAGLGLNSVYSYVFGLGQRVCPTKSAGCLDGCFSQDGRVTVEDATYAETAGLLCGGTKTVGIAGSSPLVLAGTADPCGIGLLKGTLLLAGKRARHDSHLSHDSNDTWRFLSDSLYGLDPVTSVKPDDPVCTVVSGPKTLGLTWPSTKLSRDPNGVLYQINWERGLIRVADGQTVIPTGSVLTPEDLQVQVYVYVGTPLPNIAGCPIQDVAFSTAGGVYVVPVLVVPQNNSPSYYAVARLRLASGSPPAVEWVSTSLAAPGSAPAWSSTRYEVEVVDGKDGTDHVFLFDAGNHTTKQNGGLLFLQVARTNSGPTATKPVRWDLDDVDTPTAFFVSKDGTAFLALTVSDLDLWPGHSYLLKFPPGFFGQQPLGQPEPFAHFPLCSLTGITEDPVSGTLWIAGFALGVSPEEHVKAVPTVADVRTGAILHFAPLYKTYVARVPRTPGTNETPSCTCLSYYGTGREEDLVDSISLPLSIVWMGTSN